jgi:putative transposase
MSDTYHSINLHVVFGTKTRQPLLSKDIRAELFPYIGGIARNRDAVLLHAGGVDDHVHLLLGVAPKIAPSDLLRDIKANSSRWLRQRYGIGDFGWQDGFSVFSVSPSKIASTKKYLDEQESHYERVSFGRELRDMFDAHGLPYDERYLPPV